MVPRDAIVLPTETKSLSSLYYTDLVHILQGERREKPIVWNLINLQTFHLRHGSMSKHQLIQPISRHRLLLNLEQQLIMRGRPDILQEMTIMIHAEGHNGSPRATYTSNGRRAMATYRLPQTITAVGCRVYSKTIDLRTRVQRCTQLLHTCRMVCTHRQKSINMLGPATAAVTA